MHSYEPSPGIKQIKFHINFSSSSSDEKSQFGIGNHSATAAQTILHSANHLFDRIPPIWIWYIKIVVLILIMTFTLTGNVFIIWIISSRKSLRTIPNKFILNLALSNLLSALINGPFLLIAIYFDSWPLGDTACQMNGLTTTLFGLTSILTLAGISVNRYCMILHPATCITLYTNRNTNYMIFGIWIACFIYAFPPTVGWSRYNYIPGKGICTLIWNTNISYTIFCHSLGIYIPFTVILFCYFKIFLTVRQSGKRIQTHVNTNKQKPSTTLKNVKTSSNISPPSKTTELNNDSNKDLGNNDKKLYTSKKYDKNKSIYMVIKKEKPLHNTNKNIKKLSIILKKEKEDDKKEKQLKFCDDHLVNSSTKSKNNTFYIPGIKKVRITSSSTTKSSSSPYSHNSSTTSSNNSVIIHNINVEPTGPSSSSSISKQQGKTSKFQIFLKYFNIFVERTRQLFLYNKYKHELLNNEEILQQQQQQQHSSTESPFLLKNQISLSLYRSNINGSPIMRDYGVAKTIKKSVSQQTFDESRHHRPIANKFRYSQQFNSRRSILRISNAWKEKKSKSFNNLNEIVLLNILNDKEKIGGGVVTLNEIYEMLLHTADVFNPLAFKRIKSYSNLQDLEEFYEANNNNNNTSSISKMQDVILHPKSNFKSIITTFQDRQLGGGGPNNSSKDSNALYKEQEELRAQQRFKQIKRKVSKKIFKSTNKRREDRVITKTILLIVLAFGVCWCPISMVNFIETFFHTSVPSWFDILSVYLIYVNCALNPVIYGLMNKNFSHVLREIFWCFRTKPTNLPGIDMSLKGRRISRKQSRKCLLEDGKNLIHNNANDLLPKVPILLINQPSSSSLSREGNRNITQDEKSSFIDLSCQSQKNSIKLPFERRNPTNKSNLLTYKKHSSSSQILNGNVEFLIPKDNNSSYMD